MKGIWQTGRTPQTAWRLAVFSMAGLLLAIAAADLLGLGIIARVRTIAEQAVTVDVALEDRSDDFRVAVLDMRHYHRNIIFAGPSRRGGRFRYRPRCASGPDRSAGRTGR